MRFVVGGGGAFGVGFAFHGGFAFFHLVGVGWFGNNLKFVGGGLPVSWVARFL